MNKSRLLFFLLLISLQSSAQINVDSLKAVWNDLEQPDTSRLKAMDDLTFHHYIRSIVDLDSAYFYCQQIIDLAKAKGLKKYEAIGLHNMAMAEINRRNYDHCLELNLQSLAIRKELGDEKEIGRSLSNTAQLHAARGDFVKALEYYNEALTKFEAAGEKALTAHVLNSIANVYSSNGQIQKTIEFTSRSLTVLEGSENFYFESMSLLSLATLYSNIKDPLNAMKYANLSLEKAKKINYTAGELYASLLMGKIHSSEGKHKEALLICEEVLSKTEKGEFSSVRNYAFTLMGWIYQEKGEYDKALEYYKEGIKIGEAVNDKNTELTNAIELGIIYKLKKDKNNALKWCEKALSLAQKTGNIKMQQEACKCLYETHKLLNNGIEALHFHELFLGFTDSLNIEGTSKKLQEAEFQRIMLRDSIAKAEEARMIEEKHQEEVEKKNRTRNILAGSGLLVLLFAGGIFSRLRYVRKSKATLQLEKDRSDNLLLNILPEEIAQELKIHGKAEARDFDMVSILFTDFKGFTEQSAKLSAAVLVNEINTCFETFDGIIEKYGIEKIKTIGDAYMAAGGLPIPTDDSVKNTVMAAIEMQSFISKRKVKMDTVNKPAFEMRVGIHTGPVVAGIVGVKKFQYDIWGDTVNTASRIESNGEVGKVNISHATYELLKDDSDFAFESRGKIEAKGKGEIEMYFVSLR